MDRPDPIAALYRAHFDFVWSNLRRLGVPPAQLEDAAHDVFVVVHRRHADFDGSARVETWLFGILRRVASEHRRRDYRHRRRLERARGSFAAREAPEEPFARRQALRMVQAFLRDLDEPKREVFILAQLEEMTGREVATALGINPNTAAARLRAARREFAARLKEQDSPLDASWVTSVVRSQRPPSGARRRVLAGLAPVFGMGAPADAAPSGAMRHTNNALATKVSIALTIVLAGVSGSAAAGGRATTDARPAANNVAAAAAPGREPGPSPQGPALAEPERQPADDTPAPRAIPSAPRPDPARLGRSGRKPAPHEPPVREDDQPEPEPLQVKAAAEPTSAAKAESELAVQTKIAREVAAAPNSRRVLALVRDYERRFPDGFFSEQLGARAVEALCRIGSHDAAAARVKALRRRFPRSTKLATERNPCDSITSPNRGGDSSQQ